MSSNVPPDADRISVRIDPDLADLIPGYLENRRRDVDVVRGALDQRDYDLIRSVGHKMKGSGGGYGFDPITRIGAVLEAAAVKADPDRIREALRDLSDYLERIDITYEQPD